MRAVIKAHDETANSKIDVKACLLKHMVTKQRLQNKAFYYKTKFLPVNTA